MINFAFYLCNAFSKFAETVFFIEIKQLLHIFTFKEDKAAADTPLDSHKGPHGKIHQFATCNSSSSKRSRIFCQLGDNERGSK